MRRITKKWIGIALALAASAARADQHWIVSHPTLASVSKEWKEGSLVAGTADGRSIVTIQTNGKANPTLMAVRGIAPAVDTRGRFLAVTLRVRGMKHLANLQARLSSDAFATTSFAFPIQVFADGEYNFLQDDTWASFTVSFGEAVVTGSPDRAKIDSFGLMATDDGTGTVEVDFAGAAMIDGPKQGVVSFTFDDGYKEHLEAARILAKHGWHGTAYIIPQVLGTRIGYLTAADVAEIAKLGCDVAAHDDPPFTQIPPDELEPRVRGIQSWLIDNGYSEGARHLAYPLGKQEPHRVRPTIARVFTTARIAGGGPETMPPADPQLLRALNVIDATRPEEVGAWARRARENGEWLILMFHWLPEKTEKHTDFAMSDFRRLVDEVAAAKVRVASVTEAWREAAPLVAQRTMFPPPAAMPAAAAP